MAQNQENAQSMGLRFREAQAQAAELGLGTRGDRRPARARACATGLSDHELRNLNDDINKQLRQKWTWPNRIAAGTSRFWMSVDDDRERRWTKGYKYAYYS
ncbi:hypothetical protein K438DRAFT_1790562 [Mycena galopus ATCC 62051]|nr:hypothetical protein K438DRAFT_1790562 [Mycena galopus ATCC 62051]